MSGPVLTYNEQKPAPLPPWYGRFTKGHGALLFTVVWFGLWRLERHHAPHFEIIAMFVLAVALGISVVVHFSLKKANTKVFFAWYQAVLFAALILEFFHT